MVRASKVSMSDVPCHLDDVQIHEGVWAGIVLAASAGLPSPLVAGLVHVVLSVPPSALAILLAGWSRYLSTIREVGLKMAAVPYEDRPMAMVTNEIAGTIAKLVQYVIVWRAVDYHGPNDQLCCSVTYTVIGDLELPPEDEEEDG